MTAPSGAVRMAPETPQKQLRRKTRLNLTYNQKSLAPDRSTPILIKALRRIGAAGLQPPQIYADPLAVIFRPGI